jgi:hypothetical protein
MLMNYQQVEDFLWSQTRQEICKTPIEVNLSRSLAKSGVFEFLFAQFVWWSFFKPKRVKCLLALCRFVGGIRPRIMRLLNLYFELVLSACSDAGSSELELYMLANPAEASIIATVKLWAYLDEGKDDKCLI